MTYRLFSLLIDLAILTIIGLAAMLYIAESGPALDEWRLVSVVTITLGMRAFISVIQRRSPMANFGPAERVLYVCSIGGGLLIMAGALAIKFADLYTNINDAASDRAFGILCGVFMMAIGNFTPKAHVPREDCSIKKSARVHRWIGVLFVIAGAGVILTWLVVPVGDAPNVTMGITATTIALCLIPIIRLATSSMQSNS